MRGRPATVQVLLNAANANTAQIAQGYVEGAVASLNSDLERARRVPVTLRTAFLYNPGLVNAWYIVTGVFVTGWRHRENLARAMLTGRKRASPQPRPQRRS